MLKIQSVILSVIAFAMTPVAQAARPPGLTECDTCNTRESGMEGLEGHLVGISQATCTATEQRLSGAEKAHRQERRAQLIAELKRHPSLWSRIKSASSVSGLFVSDFVVNGTPRIALVIKGAGAAAVDIAKELAKLGADSVSIGVLETGRALSVDATQEIYPHWEPNSQLVKALSERALGDVLAEIPDALYEATCGNLLSGDPERAGRFFTETALIIAPLPKGINALKAARPTVQMVPFVLETSNGIVRAMGVPALAAEGALAPVAAWGGASIGSGVLIAQTAKGELSLPDKSKVFSEAPSSIMPRKYEGVYHLVKALPIYQAALRLHMDWISRYVKKGGTVIDAGGGEGIMAQEAMARFPGLEVHMVDGSEVMLQKAIANGVPPARAHLSDIRELKIGGKRVAPESVDHIYSHSVIWHLDDVSDFAREMYRDLKPGGTLAVSTIRQTTPQLVQAFLDELRSSFAVEVKAGRISRLEAETFVQKNADILASGIKYSPTEGQFITDMKKFGFEPIETHDAYIVQGPKGKVGFFTQILFRKI